MLGYRKNAFSRAHALLSKLRVNLDDIGSLRQLQQLLIREIKNTERRSRTIKANLNAIQSTNGPSKAKRASALKSQLDKIRLAAFVWRSFGDGIAFLYLDKFAIKQTFYSVKSTAAQQSSGFLSDKTGLDAEISAVESILNLQVPAMLTDITNSIRHGDVCIMLSSDPILIEVKSSKGLDRRGRRQRDELQKLREFFETDKTDMLRGAGPAIRVAIDDNEVSYLDELEACITLALTEGHAVAQPEPGLHYIVFAGSPSDRVGEVMNSLTLKMPWLFTLNELKNSRSWAPYTPFTLSLKNLDHLWSFIRGDVFIIVLLDMQSFLDAAHAIGVQARLDRENEDYPIWVQTPWGNEAGISSHILTRAALEFVSADWLIKSAIGNIERAAEMMGAPHQAAVKRQTPTD